MAARPARLNHTVLVNNAGIGMRTVNPGFMTEPAGFWHVSPDGFRDLFGLTDQRIVATDFAAHPLS